MAPSVFYGPAQQMARRDPRREEDLGERFSQFASAHGTVVGNDLRSDNDTPALNALKALRGAPISMGRGEIPVELLAGSHPFFASFIFR